MLLDGKTPLIILGNDYGTNPKRNPLSIEQRAELIKLVFPNVGIVFDWVGDNPNWSSWWEEMEQTILNDRAKEQVTLYYHNKPEDRYDNFQCQGKEYKDEFYTKIFEDNGIRTQRVEFVERTDIIIEADATNIRDNLEAFKHLLDARVYWKLKSWGW